MNFFACGEGPFGRRPYYPNDPVDPVRLFIFKIRIHSSLSLKIYSFLFDQTGRLRPEATPICGLKGSDICLPYPEYSC